MTRNQNKNVLTVLVTTTEEHDIVFHCGIPEDERDIYVSAIESAESISDAVSACTTSGAMDIEQFPPRRVGFEIEVTNA